VHRPKIKAARFRLLWGHVGLLRNNSCLEGPVKKWKIRYL